MEEFIRIFPWLAFVFILFWACLTHVVPAVKKFRKKKRMLDEIDEKYESLRKLRQDLIYHIDWAHERGEHRQANELESEIDRIDKELEELRDRYNEIEAGKVDLNKIR
jgi:prefoldin subunit 5